MITEFVDNDGVQLAYAVSAVSMQEGKNFYSSPGDSLQVGAMRLEKGAIIDAHIHNIISRTVLETQEVIFVIEGKMKAQIFDLNHNKKGDIVLVGGDLIVLLRGGHSFDFLEPTSIFEVKQGPYKNRETDKRYLDVK